MQCRFSQFYNQEMWLEVFLVVVNERSVQRAGLRVSGNVREDNRRRSNGSFGGWLERQKGGGGKRWGRFEKQHANTATNRTMGVFQVRWRLEREQQEQERLRKIEENKKVNTHNHTHTRSSKSGASSADFSLLWPSYFSFSRAKFESKIFRDGRKKWNNGFRGGKNPIQKRNVMKTKLWFIYTAP